ncbi:MAG: hypothetical protein GX811_08030 [Lentisphaerae bacterium]|nr:hypothetical protein [Lentisphaerota bacterium]
MNKNNFLRGIVLSLTFLFVFGPELLASSLKIGWATRDITPKRPALLQGQIYERIASSAMDTLTLTAFAVDAGEKAGQQFVLVSIDICMVPEKLIEMVRSEVAKKIPGLSADSIIINATHTHTSLVLHDTFYDEPGGDVMTVAEGLEMVTEKALDAILEAWGKRSESQINNAYGHAVVGYNRRVVYNDGRAFMYGHAATPQFSHIEAQEDHGLNMIFVWSAAGDLTGLLLEVPCPSQVSENLTEFSADFWHEIRVYLRSKLGADLHVLPLTGASGDQSPRNLTNGRVEDEMRCRRGVSLREDIANRVGSEVIRALECTKPLSGQPVVAHISKTINLPRRKISQVEYDVAAKECGAMADDPEMAGGWLFRSFKDVMNCFEKDGLMPDKKAELHAIRFGAVVMVTNPFELYVDYATQIKARSPAIQTFVVQLTAGDGMYIPTERAVKGGHYSAHPMMAPVGPDGGKLIVETSLQMIREVFR